MFKLSSKLTAKVLDYYFLNPTAEKYINELAEILGEDKHNLRKKLKELEADGILQVRSSGRQMYYSLNQKYPFLKAVKELHQAKYGVESYLREGLHKIHGIKEAFIFGSYASGKMHTDSDLDLLVVGKYPEEALTTLTTKLQRRIGREINAVEMSEKEYAEKKRKGHDLLRHIFSHQYVKLI